MNCPYCNNIETKVIDSREGKDGTFVKRRRECIKCEKRFSTMEKVLKLDLEVVKANGTVESFNLTKLRKSLLRACEKRPVTLEQVEMLLDKVFNDLKKVEVATVPTSIVGKIVLKNLKELDEIAFLKFAIVHNNYGSMGEFMEEIDKLQVYDEVEGLEEVALIHKK